MLAAPAGDVGFAGVLPAWLQGNERARGFSPLFIRARHHGGFKHCRVFVQGVLDFNGGDVLATGNDDVLEAVLDLDIAVGMPHGQVTGVEPAATERFGGGFGVFQVALHHGVAAHEDLAQRVAIACHRLECLRVGHHQPVQGRVAHALT